MNYLNIDNCDLNNGIGARVTLWVSGCEFKCDGCHNKSSWDFNNGELFTRDTMEYIINLLNNEYISGLSILGGEPLNEQNRNAVIEICREVKEKFPEKDIWIWSGYTFENIIKENNQRCIAEVCDVIIDGLFNKNLYVNGLPFRGSTNQRVVDVKKSIKSKEVILYDYNS